jgi:PIN domain nuclease of toxin-antitoxin system
MKTRLTELPGEFHKDPADRMIVATSRQLAILVVTPDEKIRAYPHVRNIWWCCAAKRRIHRPW